MYSSVVLAICLVLVIELNGQCTEEFCTGSDVEKQQVLENHIELIFQQLHHLTAENLDSDWLIMQLQEEISQLRAETEQLKNNLTQLQLSSGPAYAFTAYIAGENLYQPTSTTEPLPFIELRYNKGEAFNTMTKQFSCPVHGTYFFSVSIRGYVLRKNTDKVQIAINIYSSRVGEVARAHSANNDPNHWLSLQLSTSAVIECHIGETVDVRPYNITNSKIRPASQINTFTGFLINVL